MKALVLDTATRRAVVGAVDGDEVLAAVHSEEPRAHAARLGTMVREAWQQVGWASDAVDLLAVGMGPGSFTGVRVGLAFAKGLAVAWHVPLVGVASLDAMAVSAAKVAAGPVACLLDAKKGEVFASFYDAAGRRRVEPCHVGWQQLPAWLQALAWPPGDRCVAGEIPADRLPPGFRLLRAPGCDLPSVPALAALAAQRWQSLGVDETETLEPCYVRPPDVTVPAMAPPPRWSRP